MLLSVCSNNAQVKSAVCSAASWESSVTATPHARSCGLEGVGESVSESATTSATNLSY